MPAAPPLEPPRGHVVVPTAPGGIGEIEREVVWGIDAGNPCLPNKHFHRQGELFRHLARIIEDDLRLPLVIADRPRHTYSLAAE
jgi:hypothetical protein